MLQIENTPQVQSAIDYDRMSDKCLCPPKPLHEFEVGEILRVLDFYTTRKFLVTEGSVVGSVGMVRNASRLNISEDLACAVVAFMVEIGVLLDVGSRGRFIVTRVVRTQHMPELFKIVTDRKQSRGTENDIVS